MYTTVLNLQPFVVEKESRIGNTLVLQVVTRKQADNCPNCGQYSNTIHGYYWRHVQELAWSAWQVMLQIRAKRFSCANEGCEKRTFVEQFPEVLRPYARRTMRVLQRQQTVTLGMAARQAEPTLSVIGIGSSDSTLNVQLRQLADPMVQSEVEVLGVDDWAQCKRRSYGTILVDLETHTVIDLLPDRRAETLRVWLEQQPAVAVISRDRAGAYAEGATQGAPEAQQVADRWHLLHNLWEAVANSLEPHAQYLRAFAIAQQDQAGDNQSTELKQIPALVTPKIVSPKRPLSPIEQIRLERRQKWEIRFQEVKEYQAQGMCPAAIIRQTRLAPRTVRKYLKLSELPIKTSPKPERCLSPKPFHPYLTQRLRAEPVPSVNDLYDEIRDQGYQQSRSLLYTWVAQLRHELGIATPAQAKRAIQSKLSCLTPRKLATLLFTPPQQCTTRHDLNPFL